MDDEKSFDLRDRIALELLNGLLSSGDKNLPDFHGYIMEHVDGHLEPWRIRRTEKMVRACYDLADIIRKVRLSAFE
jgi:hypothetical protein